MVITSHDPGRWNFSDSTDLSEALLIATRRAKKHKKVERRTTFVNLWRNPDGVLDAHRMASAIAATTPAKLEETGTALLEVDGRHVGEVFSIPAPKLARKQWSGVQFARADVVRSALKLLDGGEVWVPGQGESSSIPLRRLDELGRVGPDVRRLSDGFDRTSSVTAYPVVEGHDTEQRISLKCVARRLSFTVDKAKRGAEAGLRSNTSGGNLVGCSSEHDSDSTLPGLLRCGRRQMYCPACGGLFRLQTCYSRSR